MLESETDARMVGYGGMLMESFVAVMALIAACALTPGVYFAINAPAGAHRHHRGERRRGGAHWGFTLTPAEMEALARAGRRDDAALAHGRRAEPRRRHGAPVLATCSAAAARWRSGITSRSCSRRCSSSTTLDAGTRVGRFMLQDLGKHVWEPFGRVSWYPAVVLSSAMIVAMWGHFLYQGVIDPLGGINSLWPLFGISNQLLAAVALCVGTTVIIKMGKARYAFITLMPIAWLDHRDDDAPGGRRSSRRIRSSASWRMRRLVEGQVASGALPAAIKTVGDAQRMIFNDYLDAGVAAFFMISVVVILAASFREWASCLRGAKPVTSTEVPFEAMPVPGTRSLSRG